MELHIATRTLSANIGFLSMNDQSFAKSLLKSKSPSAKQADWIVKLATKATTTTADAPAALLVPGVFEAFSTASANLKKPKVLIAGEPALRVTVLGSGSKNPGDLAVTDTSKDFEARRYFGRVTKTGQFVASPKEADARIAVWGSLMAFGADPAGTAAAYGKATGACCFCAKELTDPVSIGWGYGPTCAANWGLPH
jgi:Family of unknown function (DUF6011)